MTTQAPLVIDKKFWHTRHMSSRARKAKRDNGIVMYIRVTPEMHDRIAEVAKKRESRRGYPHAMSNVAVEMIAQGLRVEAQNEEHP